MTRATKFLMWTFRVVATLVLIGVITHVWLDYKYGRELDRLISRLKAEGVPLTYGELAAGQPPDDKNAALLVLKAFPPREPSLDDPELEAPYMRYDQLKPGHADTKLLNEIRSDLRARADQMELLHRAARLPESRYPIVAKRSGGKLHLDLAQDASVRHATYLLGAEAAVRATDGDSHGAVESLVCAIRVADTLRNGPGLFAAITRFSAFRSALGTAENALALATFPSGDLRTLQAALGQARAAHSLRPSYLCEFAPVIEGNDANTNGPAWNPFRPYWRATILRWLRMLDRQLALCDTPWRQWPEKDRRSSQMSFLSPAYVLAGMMAPIGREVVRHRDDSQARISGARIAIALILYHRRTGQYPDKLEQATVDMGGPLPRDPFSGKPFRYWHDANGYRFWSIGANLEDDGGRAAEQSWDRPAGDIVWETGALTPVCVSRNAQD